MVRILKFTDFPYARAKMAPYRKLLLWAALVALLSLAVSPLLPAAPALGGLALFVAFSLWSSKTSSDRSGIQGEVAVTRELRRLNDSWLLLDDVSLPGLAGNIDHILVGPGGVYAIETKNWGGRVGCRGNNWYRTYWAGKRRPREYATENPCRQVKDNARRVSQELGSIGRFWVNALVVFSHSQVKLDLFHPTGKVLKLNELCRFLTAQPQSLPSDVVDEVGAYLQQSAPQTPPS